MINTEGNQICDGMDVHALQSILNGVVGVDAVIIPSTGNQRDGVPDYNLGKVTLK